MKGQKHTDGKFEGGGKSSNLDVGSSWLKPVIGIIFFMVVMSIFFKALTFLLPIVLISTLIFFGIKFFNQNGVERGRWEAWGKQFGEDAARWGKDFGERAATGLSRCKRARHAAPKMRIALPKPRQSALASVKMTRTC